MEEGGGMEPSGFPIPGRPWAAAPAAVTGGRGETRDPGCPGLGPRPAEKRARSRGRVRVGARAPAVIGRHGGSFLSAPLCFALWF